jgi:hypothetical protein
MYLVKLAAAAAVLASIALVVAIDDGEQAVTTPTPQPAAVPLAELGIGG